MDKTIYLQELEEALIQNDYSLKEMVACISYARNLLDSGLPVIFDTTHFALLIGIEPKALASLIHSIDTYCYHEHKVPKKSGGVRVLSIPSFELKYIQRWILDNILSHMHVSENAHGFIPRKSILTNALLHSGKECVVSMDIKDFFPSVTFEQVFRLFKYYGYTTEVSYILARLCTYNGTLPQGSPASPAITNVICLRLDKRLNKLATSFGGTYSRYADDLTFSGSKGIKKMIPIVKEIVENEGFFVNDNKTRISYAYQKQEVNGLIVNNKVHISSKYKRKLRQEIYYCKQFGVSNHQEHCNEVYNFYKEHLYGKAYFIKMIEPEVGDIFLSKLDEIKWEY